MSTSKLELRTRARSLEERYEMLRKTLAHYLLLQVGTFVSAIGFDRVAPAMSVLTDKKAELKVRDVKKQGNEKPRDAVKALSLNLAESMGETFASDYYVEKTDSSEKVVLSRCGCIESVMVNPEDYGMTKAQTRSIFCSTCMSSYKKAAETLDLRFNGKLSKEGCMMQFSAP